MSDILDPTSKAAKPAHAPYLCPHCERPMDNVAAVPNGPLMVFYHQMIGCNKVLNVQLLAAPRSVATPMIQVPGVKM